MSQLLFNIKGKSPADASLRQPLRLQLQPEKYEIAHNKNMNQILSELTQNNQNQKHEGMIQPLYYPKQQIIQNAKIAQTAASPMRSPKSFLDIEHLHSMTSNRKLRNREAFNQMLQSLKQITKNEETVSLSIGEIVPVQQQTQKLQPAKLLKLQAPSTGIMTQRSSEHIKQRPQPQYLMDVVGSKNNMTEFIRNTQQNWQTKNTQNNVLLPQLKANHKNKVIVNKRRLINGRNNIISQSLDLRNDIEQMQNYLNANNKNKFDEYQLPPFSANSTDSFQEANDSHFGNNSRNRHSKVSNSQKSPFIGRIRHPIKVNSIIFQDNQRSPNNESTPFESVVDEQENLDKCSIMDDLFNQQFNRQSSSIGSALKDQIYPQSSSKKPKLQKDLISTTINETQQAAEINKHTHENVNFDPNKAMGTTGFINFRPIVSSKRRISYYDMHIRQ